MGPRCRVALPGGPRTIDSRTPVRAHVCWDSSTAITGSRIAEITATVEPNPTLPTHQVADYIARRDRRLSLATGTLFHDRSTTEDMAIAIRSLIGWSSTRHDLRICELAISTRRCPKEVATTSRRARRRLRAR